MVAEEDDSALIYVWSHVVLSFDSEVAHRRDGLGRYLGSEFLIFLDGYLFLCFHYTDAVVLFSVAV